MIDRDGVRQQLKQIVERIEDQDLSEAEADVHSLYQALETVCRPVIAPGQPISWAPGIAFYRKNSRRRGDSRFWPVEPQPLDRVADAKPWRPSIAENHSLCSRLVVALRVLQIVEWELHLIVQVNDLKQVLP
jgi:hypothetical protein